MTDIPASASSKLIGTAGGVSNDTSRLLTKDNLKKAGNQFESIFIGMMMKSMRSANLSEGLFDNKAGEQFRDMQDARIAENMATHAPLGIGKAMTDFLAKAAKSATDAAPAATAAATDAAAPADGSAS